MVKKKKILIFIITYKASFRVKNVFNEIPFKKLGKHNLKILISDDCSNDDTIDFIKKIQNRYKKLIVNLNQNNIGYGAHIKKCLNFAIKNKFNYAIMIHGDGQYSPSYIPKLISLASRQNVGAVTGSRIKKGLEKVKKGGMPLYKLMGNILLTKIFNLLMGTNFTDTHTGLWLYNLDKLKDKSYQNLTNTFNFDQEFRFKNIVEKRVIEEIPITTKYGDERSQLHIIYALKFFFNSIYYFLIKNKFLRDKKFKF